MKDNQVNSLSFQGDRHAIRSNFTLRAHNHFYRCRGVKEDENAVNQHDSVFP